MGNVNPFSKLEDSYFLQKVKLGEGAFGTVWRGVDKRTEELVAVKALKKGHNAGRSRKDYEHEVSIMKQVKHTNVLGLRDVFEDTKNVYLVIDYCDGGDLGDKMAECTQKSVAASWMAQVCAAIGAMHYAGIVHRDVKPDNFMISNGCLKLADFGLATMLPEKEGLLKAKCGTPAFMAPEQHELPNSRGYGKAADMWAAGVILFMLLHGGQHPFLSGNQMNMQALLSGKFPKNGGSKLACLMPGKSGASNGMELVAALLFREDYKRLSAVQALQHPFLSAQRRNGAGGKP